MKFNRPAQSIINRISAVMESPRKFDKNLVIKALTKYYELLGVEMPKVEIADNLVMGFKLSTDAARDAAWGAARGAAWGAARDAAAANIGLKDKAVIKYIAIEMEMLKAMEAGLGWYFPMKDKLILVPLPEFRVDDKGRPHSEDKPAIEWPTLKYYFYHGVKIEDPKIILKPSKLTKKDWLDEENLEVRRVIQERMGENFVKKIGGKKLNKGKFGELVEVNLGSDPERIAKYVHVKDPSTTREYYLRVPKNIETADSGVAWTFNVPVDKYKPMQQT